MFSFFKKKHAVVQQNRLYDRLKRIAKYCQEVTLDSADKISINFSTEHSQRFYFQSALGTVQIDIYWCDSYIEIAYANYAGTLVFFIQSDSCKNEVEPLLGETLTAHDIDLAILELEEYLMSTFGNIDEIIKTRAAQEIAKQLRHEEELRKLF